MSIKTSHWAITFIVSFVAGFTVSALLMLTAIVIMFILGARSGIPYEFSIGSLLVFKLDLSEGNLGMEFGLGFLAIAFVLGLINALIAIVLKPRRSPKMQLPLR